MDITLAGTRPTRRAPKENFTGTVLQDPINMAPAPARLNVSRVSFEPGESVRVVDGPFANFSAKVEEVKADKQKVKVSLSMFGRTTAVELDFAQVEKA